jgi:beta-galactosidase/beta-glucuronidase
MKTLLSKLTAVLLLSTLAGQSAEWKAAPSTLTTPWTAQVHPGSVLPEYPRPQMVRPQWINLNGLWEYAITSKEESRPAQFDGRILVPFALESSLSGVKRPLTPEQRLWYRRSFSLPNLHNRHLILHFGAVDWRTEVFVNGVKVGEHEGGYDPFALDITTALKKESVKQELLVSVWDPTDTALHPRGKQSLHPNGIWYTAVSGIWQTVWLEPVPSAYINNLSLTPDLDHQYLRLLVSCSGTDTFTATARLNGRRVGHISGQTGEATVLPLQQVAPWSPDTPVLYSLEIRLASGDSVQSYFGMRKIEIAKDHAGFNRLFLNGKPVFAIGPLDQGWWPDGLYTAPTDAAIRFDLETLKKLGFNMLRKHVKVESARYYYWCDRLGLLVWQDMPSAMTEHSSTGVRRGSPTDVTFPADAAADFERELKALIDNLKNTPSIVAWVPFNEGWGQHDTNAILKMVKDLDPSRLVDGPSGWEDRGYGDMKDMHNYPGPGMFPVMPERASVLGEFGGLGYPIPGHLWWTDKRNWGYRTYTTRAELESAYEALLQKLAPLVQSGLAAAVYTQTTDVEGEVNGLMTYDRKVIKFQAERLAQRQRALRSSLVVH